MLWRFSSCIMSKPGCQPAPGELSILQAGGCSNTKPDFQQAFCQCFASLSENSKDNSLNVQPNQNTPKYGWKRNHAIYYLVINYLVTQSPYSIDEDILFFKQASQLLWTRRVSRIKYFISNLDFGIVSLNSPLSLHLLCERWNKSLREQHFRKGSFLCLFLHFVKSHES